jgi:hypothetical protein
VLWGSCSEAELALPYLPFVEAVGNHLGDRDPAVVRAELGPAATELAQLLPQLAGDRPSRPVGDPAQAKLRLFESLVTLMELWSRDRGLILVVDDLHWADDSTRELLGYAARRLVTSRVMLLATYRSDELDRRHPLTRAVQVWRRAGLAETITVSAMTAPDVAEMIAAILNADEVNAELASLVDARAEGNPFVLEEMLKEALDQGEISRTETGWERSSVGGLRMPETVREAVLLRLGRLDADQVEVLRAAAVLGRSFDYGLLVQAAAADEDVVLAALESAVAQQLLDEDAEGSDRYSWRHALTHEAIASDTVAPKRQQVHSRAADSIARTGGTATALAHHLLGAGPSSSSQTASGSWIASGSRSRRRRRGSISGAAAGSSISRTKLSGISRTPGTFWRTTARRPSLRSRTSGSPGSTRSRSTTSSAALRPSAPPRLPNRPRPTTSASGLSPTWA